MNAKMVTAPNRLFDAERVVEQERAKDKKTRGQLAEIANEAEEDAIEARGGADKVELAQRMTDAVMGIGQAGADYAGQGENKRGEEGIGFSLLRKGVNAAMTHAAEQKNDEAFVLETVVKALRDASEGLRDHTRSLA